MVMIRNIIVFALTFCVILTAGYLNIAVGETVGSGGQVATSVLKISASGRRLAFRVSLRH